ncbi:hypothetical protein AC578_8305 [Pseudocercospora eumusae]|uniref:Uncharacterized protein n=1 Tax=Pseudocercospora eumusae TaxID=321146 RepID=A0A139H2W7_9PEZI|nr:hypothetical protein AC578_8305 [Pseudocercospora eumusae]
MDIVSSAEWAALEKRSNRSVGLEVMIVDVIGKVFCFDEKKVAILKDNMFGDDGSRPNSTMENHKLIHGSLAPGDELEVLIEQTLENVSKQVNVLGQAVDTDDKTVNIAGRHQKRDGSMHHEERLPIRDQCIQASNIMIAGRSTFKETLRLVAPSHTNRVIAEDTLVTNLSDGQTCLLKKGATIRYASRP